MAARLIVFRGSHPNLTTGHMYTSGDYAKASGICATNMSHRLYRVHEVQDSHLRPRENDTPTERLSGAWIKRKLL